MTCQLEVLPTASLLLVALCQSFRKTSEHENMQTRSRWMRTLNLMPLSRKIPIWLKYVHSPCGIEGQSPWDRHSEQSYSTHSAARWSVRTRPTIKSASTYTAGTCLGKSCRSENPTEMVRHNDTARNVSVLLLLQRVQHNGISGYVD